MLSRAQRFANALLDQFGHEQEFEVEVTMPDREEVIAALEEKGCFVTRDPLHSQRMTVLCPKAVEPSRIT